MAVDLYTFVDLHRRVLDTAAHILTRGAEHAARIDGRLIEDKRPLRFQIMVVCNFPRQWMARVVGAAVPEAVGADLTLTGFQSAIAEAKQYLEGLTPEQFKGRDDVPLTVDIGQLEPTLPAGRWLTVFATTNLYFHLSTAYAILRSKGVPIGKIDLFPSGL